ncbi:MAG: nicotinate-nucleotide diphosphorylase (carboxylating) [Gammaproteobacteria bacterium HGW-Gammaproteobacteria-8]|nr:MAG: nicotinate-nucleotide diphosphorylase (carboxylating) [Gammaproteobacteria bacterium HGW-Gammaproteobacteria-8]
MNIPTGLIRNIVERALTEDLGERGDITTAATIPADITGRFQIVARRPGVLAGRAPAELTFNRLDATIKQHWRLGDGDRLEPGTVVAELQGPAGAILSAERSALNFLGRLSGIATLTRAFVDAVAGTGTAIAHTRKTTPGLRALEIAAVLAGGGAPHRFGLDDAVLIKDNHVAMAGGVAAAITRARAAVGHMTRIAVEIDHLDQLEEALEAGAESLLLDNFAPADLSVAVTQTAGRAKLEASGNVTLDTARAIAETGVDVISIGALTHSAPNLDLGLDALD